MILLAIILEAAGVLPTLFQDQGNRNTGGANDDWEQSPRGNWEQQKWVDPVYWNLDGIEEVGGVAEISVHQFLFQLHPLCRLFSTSAGGN